MFQRLSKVWESLSTGKISVKVQPDLTDAHICTCFPHFPPYMHFFSCLFRNSALFQPSVRTGIQDSVVQQVSQSLSGGISLLKDFGLSGKGINASAWRDPCRGSKPSCGWCCPGQPEQGLDTVTPTGPFQPPPRSDSLGVSPGLWWHRAAGMETMHFTHTGTLHTLCPPLPLPHPVPLFPSAPFSDAHALVNPEENFATIHQEFLHRHGKQRKISGILSLKTFWRYPWGAVRKEMLKSQQ